MDRNGLDEMQRYLTAFRIRAEIDVQLFTCRVTVCHIIE